MILGNEVVVHIARLAVAIDTLTGVVRETPTVQVIEFLQDVVIAAGLVVDRRREGVSHSIVNVEVEHVGKVGREVEVLPTTVDRETAGQSGVHVTDLHLVILIHYVYVVFATTAVIHDVLELRHTDLRIAVRIARAQHRLHGRTRVIGRIGVAPTIAVGAIEVRQKP